MTRLLDDLTEITNRYGNAKDAMLAPVPIGAIRAARIMLERYEGFPLADRNTEVSVVPQVRRAWQRKGYRDHA